MPAAAEDSQGRVVAEICRNFLPGLVGVYLHGSAALGGLGPASDLDVLAVTDAGGDLDGLGQALLDSAVGGVRALELSVVARGDAAEPAPPWPYLLHVNSAESRVVRDDGAGDPDLLAHYAVTRRAGIVVVGPAPYEVIGPVEPAALVAYFRDELQWALANADERYAVLNACRACRYADTGDLVSKVDGGRWWLEARGTTPVVQRALSAQVAGADLGPVSEVAREFVLHRLAEVRGGRS